MDRKIVTPYLVCIIVWPPIFHVKKTMTLSIFGTPFPKKMTAPLSHVDEWDILGLNFLTFIGPTIKALYLYQTFGYVKVNQNLSFRHKESIQLPDYFPF